MTLKEFAKMLDGRQYGQEITKEEETLAKRLGFVVVYGYSDDCAELRGAINDEIGCFGGGKLEHDDLPSVIYADWAPEDIDCAWAYGTQIEHEDFCIYEDDKLYCVGIVCDINRPKPTKADRFRVKTDEELAAEFVFFCPTNSAFRGEPDYEKPHYTGFDGKYYSTSDEVVHANTKWLQTPAEGE